MFDLNTFALDQVVLFRMERISPRVYEKVAFMGDVKLESTGWASLYSAAEDLRIS